MNEELLRKLAAEAAQEIEFSPAGQTDWPKTRALETYLMKSVASPLGAESGDPALWRRIGESLGEDFGPDVENADVDPDVHLWRRGVVGEIALFILPGQRQIRRETLRRNILNFCNAIRALA